MAAITSAQTGNWGSTSTWTGGVVPGNGDSVVINNGHTVTVSDSRIVGTSPAAITPLTTSSPYDLDLKSTGALVITSGGRLSLRGYGIMRTWGGIAIDVDGGIFEFDGSVSGVGYEFALGEDNTQARTLKGRNGAIFRSHPSGPPGRFVVIVGARGLNGDFQGAPGSPIVFERIGGPSFGSRLCDSPYVTSIFRDVVFRDCGQLAFFGNGGQDTIFERVTVLTPQLSVGERAFDITSNWTNNTSRRHKFIDCSFGKDCGVYFILSVEAEVSGCTFLGHVNRAGGAGPTKLWKDNTIDVDVSYNQMCATEEGCYYLSPSWSGNGHSWNFTLNNPNPPNPSYLIDATMEFLNDPAAGDPVSDGEFTSSQGKVTADLIVQRAIVIPQHDGQTPVSAEWPADDYQNLVTYDRCTCGSGPLRGVFGFGHAGDDGSKTDRAQLINTIAANFSDTPNSGYKTFAISNDVADGILPYRAHHNCGWRLAASRYPATTASGYTSKLTNTAVAMGANDVDVDPWPHWPTDPAARRAVLPRLRTWATSIGLTGTGKEKEDAALTAIHVRHLPAESGYVAGVTATSLRDWVRNGWKPSNPLLETASSTGGWIGAVDGQVASTAKMIVVCMS